METVFVVQLSRSAMAMAAQEDADEDVAPVDEYTLYQEFWTWLLELEFHASCGELDSFHRMSAQSHEVLTENHEEEVKHMFVGMGFVDETHGPSEDKDTPRWRIELAGKPMQRVYPKSGLIISVSHPVRDALFYRKSVSGSISFPGGTAIDVTVASDDVEGTRRLLASHGNTEALRIDVPAHRIGYDWQLSALEAFCFQRSILSELFVNSSLQACKIEELNQLSLAKTDILEAGLQQMETLHRLNMSQVAALRMAMQHRI